jgi:hypothetical protein
MPSCQGCLRPPARDACGRRRSLHLAGHAEVFLCPRCLTDSVGRVRPQRLRAVLLCVPTALQQQLLFRR